MVFINEKERLETIRSVDFIPASSEAGGTVFASASKPSLYFRGEFFPALPEFSFVESSHEAGRHGGIILSGEKLVDAAPLPAG